MSSGLLTPEKESLHEVLAMVYGDELVIEDGPNPPTQKPMCAVYLADDNKPIALAVCDSNFSAFAGASLSMIPVGGAEDAAQSGDLSKAMRDNLYEVLNICSKLFMDDTTPHLRLGKMYDTVADLPDDAKALLENAGGPAFDVSIPRYGKGILSLVS